MPETFIKLRNVELDKNQAREILKTLSRALNDSIIVEKYNVAFNILYQDTKFVELMKKFYEDFEENQVKSFSSEIAEKQSKEEI